MTTLGPRHVGVPKRDLPGPLVTAFEHVRLAIAPGLPLADSLAREVAAFRVKLSQSGHDSYNAGEGEHDDLVLAVALTTWYARRLRSIGRPVAGGQRSPAFLVHRERLRRQLERLPDPARYTPSAGLSAQLDRLARMGSRRGGTSPPWEDRV